MTQTDRPDGDDAVARDARRAHAGFDRWMLLYRVAPLALLPTGALVLLTSAVLFARTWEFSWGIPVLLVAIYGFFRGFADRERATRAGRARAGQYQGGGGWWLVAAWALTLVGFAGPFWLNGVMSG